ncbi:2-succinyl-5-enolpyruvyl-6-hydroxy-3-cyclohexene-1-carboxylic-acid synthase [Dermabacteraceae bacterium P7054]
MSSSAKTAPAANPWQLSIPLPASSGSGAVDAATVLWRALAALGVREVLASPGSRSAPLIYGLQRAAGGGSSPLRAHVRIDERAAAFTALGVGKASGVPAAVFTTSGTATAHLHAAVMEAHHSRIPLILVTADRPAELREVGANQTTRQAGMYGSLTRWSVDLPAPVAGAATPAELRTMADVAARAYAAATGPVPGPVHLNLAFRDPLTPDFTAPDRAKREGAGVNAGEGALSLPVFRASAAPAPSQLPLRQRTLIVAGDSARLAPPEIAAPVLAEPSSNLRRGECAITRYLDLLPGMLEAGPAHLLFPERVIVTGHPTLSRPVVAGLLGRDDVETVILDDAPGWADPARRANLVTAALDTPATDGSFLRAWREAEAALPKPEGLPWQARLALDVWSACGAGDTLMLASSSLIRDLERYAPASEARVYAHRGLAGIDGTFGCAAGIALARGRTRVLAGDLAALHDMTSLLIGPLEQRPDLDIVVADDGGGRIFGGLEHAGAGPELLGRFFTTPHGADIAALAAATGAEVTLAERGRGVQKWLTAKEGGIRVLVAREAS